MRRITIDEERSQFSTKLEINPSVWDNKSGKAKGNGVNAANINRMLDNIRGKVTMHYNKLMDVNGYATPKRLKMLCLVWKKRVKRSCITSTNSMNSTSQK